MNVKAGEHRRSELCSLDVTISARYDWPVACLFHYVIGISGILPHNRNVTLQTFLSITRDFFCLDNTLARLYNAAASPASRLRSAGSLAIKFSSEEEYYFFATPQKVFTMRIYKVNGFFDGYSIPVLSLVWVDWENTKMELNTLQPLHIKSPHP